MPTTIAVAMIAAMFGSSPASHKADEPGCGIYPAPVIENALGWSACDMKKIGEPALWKGLPKGTAKISRFVFTEGHDFFFRVITVTEFTDGRAVMKITGTRKRDSIYVPERRIARRSVNLTPEDIGRLYQLGEQSGVWEFEMGTWDEEDGTIYLHCQLLEMERMDGAGYKYSSVNIGCNHPAKLMPLVNEIVRLGGIKTINNGRLYY